MCTKTFLHLPEEKRTRFLEAAWEEFTRVSFAEASTNQIVRRAGVPRGSFYQYFRDKEDLFAYLMTQARDHFIELYAKIMEKSGGDFFKTQLMCFESFAHQGGEKDVLFNRCIQVLRLNPGLHMQMIMQEQPRNHLLAEFGKTADLFSFGDEEMAREAFMLSLLALAGAVMDSLGQPERVDEYQRQLELRLNIIKWGCLTADGAGAARRNI